MSKIISYHDHGLYKVHRHPLKTFKVPKTYERMPEDRWVGCDPKSYKIGKELRTATISLDFYDATRNVSLETVDMAIPAHALSDTLLERYGVHDTPSLTRQRAPRQRSNLPRATRGAYRDGRRKKVEPILLIFNDLESALGRLFRNDPRFRRAVRLGDKSNPVPIDDYEYEIAKLIPGGSGCSFEIYVRHNHQIIRIIGRNNKGYLSDDIDANAEAFLAPDRIVNVSMPEDGRAWDAVVQEMLKQKSAVHARYARELHEKLFEELVNISPKVIRRDGTLPYSAASAAGKIMFAMSEVEEWERPTDRVTQAGALSYAGGRHFMSVEPGYYENLWHYDARSFYPWIMTLLPDPSTCQYIDIEPGKFQVENWLGTWGAMCISGNVNRGAPLRFHDIHNRRMGYLQGPFTHQWAPIPEIVLGVITGELTVTSIHDGIQIVGSNKHSFLRQYQLKMWEIKESSAPGSLRYELVKLLMNAPSGKLAEINTNHPYIDVTAGKTRVPVDSHRYVLPLIDAYVKSNEDLFLAADTAFEYSRHQNDSMSFSKLLDRTLPFGATTGARYLPMHAAQITGLGSALLNIAATTTGAIMGYTDSITTVGDASEGIAKYREIAHQAGYNVTESGMGSFQPKVKGGHGWIARDNQWVIRNVDRETGEVQQLDALHNFPNIDDNRSWDAVRKMVQTRSYSYQSEPRPAHLKEAYQMHIEPGTMITQERTVQYQTHKTKPSPDEVQRSLKLLQDANENLARMGNLPTTSTAAGCIKMLSDGINGQYLTRSQIAERIGISPKVIKNIVEGVATGQKQLEALQQLVSAFEQEIQTPSIKDELDALIKLDPKVGTPAFQRMRELSDRLLAAS